MSLKVYVVAVSCLAAVFLLLLVLVAIAVYGIDAHQVRIDPDDRREVIACLLAASEVQAFAIEDGGDVPVRTFDASSSEYVEIATIILESIRSGIAAPPHPDDGGTFLKFKSPSGDTCLRLEYGVWGLQIGESKLKGGGVTIKHIVGGKIE